MWCNRCQKCKRSGHYTQQIICITFTYNINAIIMPIYKGAMMSTLTVQCHREDETVRERTGHPPSIYDNVFRV